MNREEEKSYEVFCLFMSIITIIAIISAVVFISNKSKQDKKIYETRMEQARKNVGIAERLLEKELSKDKKYFLLSDEKDDDLLGSTTSWVKANENLICHVLVEGKINKVYFRTNKLEDNDIGLELYEPIAIDKIVEIK